VLTSMFVAPCGLTRELFNLSELIVDSIDELLPLFLVSADLLLLVDDYLLKAYHILVAYLSLVSQLILSSL
jgi:hypothetical protein